MGSRNVLYAGERLNPGQSLSNGNYELRMQPDGNLVLFDKHKGNTIWATNTSGHTNSHVTMQTDGNFVMYPENSSEAIWSSKTWHAGSGENYALFLQESGNLVIYSSPVWQTGTGGK